VSCFAMMFVPLWKFLAMNISQISGACSLIRQKELLLHNGNSFPSFPLVRITNMKGSYEGMKLPLGKVEYDKFKWNLGGDLKVVAWYSECNSGTQNIAVSCVSGTARTRRITM